MESSYVDQSDTVSPLAKGRWIYICVQEQSLCVQSKVYETEGDHQTWWRRTGLLFTGAVIAWYHGVADN